MRPARTALVWAGIAATLALACRDDAGPRRATEAVLSLGPVTLAIGDSLDVEVTCLDAQGRTLPASPVHWTPLYSQVAMVSPRGQRAWVHAIAEGQTWIVADCARVPRSPSEYRAASSGWVPGDGNLHAEAYVIVTVEPVGPISWEIEGADTVTLRAPTVGDSITGVTHLFMARGTMADRRRIPPDEFLWASSASSVVTVTPGGVARAVAVGTGTLSATRGDTTRHVVVRVVDTVMSPDGDLALVDAHWTQGPQDQQQRIPIIRNGRAAVVNVLAHATQTAVGDSVELVVWDTAGVEVHRAVRAVRPAHAEAPTFASPSAQFLVPRVVVSVAAAWRLVARRGAGVGDADAANDAWPRTGRAALHTVTAPTLKIHLVPIRLQAHRKEVPFLPPDAGAYYDSILRLRQPVGPVEISVHPALGTRADFFVEGDVLDTGGTAFFQRVLDEVDAERVRHPQLADRYWVGVIPKPIEARSTRWGGMAYLSPHADAIGPMTRTSVVISHEWLANPVGIGNTVSHELGHNFGRMHAPCGNAGGADPYFPVPGGRVGKWYTQTTALEGAADMVARVWPDTTPDFMGYCSSNFVGAYNYAGILRFRQLGAQTALRVEEPAQPVLAVRGWVHAGRARLTVVEFAEGTALSGAPDAPIIVELLNAGEVMLRVRAQLGESGDDATGRPFTAQVPVDAEQRNAVTAVRVRVGTTVVLRTL